jgi:hypothetical protein
MIDYETESAAPQWYDETDGGTIGGVIIAVVVIGVGLALLAGALWVFN